MAPRIAASPLAQRPADDARSRLLHAALRLFAQQGYSTTSTRELAEAARVNIAAISYYFGDKAGLYRAAFFEPLGDSERDIALYSGAGLGLAQALRGFFAGFLEPLKQGDAARLCMKLRFREMLEPTGLWHEAVKQDIQPMHDALLVVLCRHLQLPAPDADVQRLALCLAGLGVQLHVCREVNEQLAPGLHGGADALDRWSDTLVRFALAMVKAEVKRRRDGAAAAEKAAAAPKAASTRLGTRKPAQARPGKPAVAPRAGFRQASSVNKTASR